METLSKPNPASFRCGYLGEDVIDDLGKVIRQAKKDLANVDFDTLVGTGFSGGLVVPALAIAMKKNYVLIRKEADDSHHGGGRLVGKLGARWIFVDDFVGRGTTRDRVRLKIAEGIAEQNDYETMYRLGRPSEMPYSTTEVGAYLYAVWDNKYREFGNY